MATKDDLEQQRARGNFQRLQRDTAEKWGELLGLAEAEGAAFTAFSQQVQTMFNKRAAEHNQRLDAWKTLVTKLQKKDRNLSALAAGQKLPFPDMKEAAKALGHEAAKAIEDLRGRSTARAQGADAEATALLDAAEGSAAEDASEEAQPSAGEETPPASEEVA